VEGCEGECGELGVGVEGEGEMDAKQVETALFMHIFVPQNNVKCLLFLRVFRPIHVPVARRIYRFGRFTFGV